LDKLVVRFYKDIYRASLVEGDGIIGFQNKYFNNAIMSPNFLTRNDLPACLIEEHRKKFDRDSYWLNIFSGQSFKSINSFEKGLNLQYVLNNRKHHNPIGYMYRFEVISHLFGRTKEDFMELTALNSFGLDVPTQNKISKVIGDSRAGVEYLLAYKGSELIGGFTIVHGKELSLFINGSLMPIYRQQGVFKKMLATGINHSIEQGKEGAIYWTLNDRLKNQGNAHIDLDILDFK
jgi:hypothetical protein